jgi:hypothetical protein
MEFKFEDYLAGIRESHKTDRERELERKLQRIAAKHRDAMVAESAPLFEELSRIEMRKDPLPIMVDGKMYAYVGPKPGQ